jgi:hypothetical protein
MVLVWLACAMVYEVAAGNGAIAPTASWQSNDRASACSAPPGHAIDWTRCPELPQQYPAFSALAYSLEHLVPFVDLQQRRLWSVAGERTAPSAWGTAARLVAWYEALLGWAGWLLVALCLISALNRRRGEA